MASTGNKRRNTMVRTVAPIRESCKVEVGACCLATFRGILGGAEQKQCGMEVDIGC